MSTTMELVDHLGNEYPLKLGNTSLYGPDHPLVCTSWDLGYPDVRTNVDDRIGQSGYNDSTLYYGGATVTLDIDVKDGEIAGSTFGTLTRHQWIDKLQTLANVRFRPYLYIQAEGWAQQRRASLRANELSFTVDQKAWRKLPITMTFSRNTMTSVTPVEGSVRPLTTTSGLSLPFVFPMSFDPGTSTDYSTLVNTGSAYASPIYYIYGACSNPAIQNRDTGEYIAFTNLSVAEGHYIEIDVARRTVKMDSTSSVYGNLNMGLTTWWQLAPGDNNVRFIASNQNSSCQLFYRYYSEWV